jgi:hypothetical protein
VRRDAHALRRPTRASAAFANRRPSARWLAIVVAAMLSFVWQSFVTQTHIHFDTPEAAARAQPLGHVGLLPHVAHRPAPVAPASCPICQDAAHAAFYLSPDPILLAAPAAFLLWLAVAVATPWIGRRRSHAWHSRGPPTPLHA